MLQLPVKLAVASVFLLCGLLFAFETHESGLGQNTVADGWSCPTAMVSDNNALSKLPTTWAGTGQGKTRLLYRDYKQVHGHDYRPRSQGQAPSCVGQAAAAGADFLAATQIKKFGTERPPRAGASAAIIYGLSRHQIGQIKAGFGGGSHCIWACKAMQRYGVVPMVEYHDLGVDLSDPSAKLCVQYGSTGVPPPLQDIARQHSVIEYIKIDTFEELRDAIQNGCPVIVGSRQGFGPKSGAIRDSDGFLVPPRYLFRRSTWSHAMLFIGVRDTGRKGALILNSWGPRWVSGPKMFDDEPEGCFWADRRVVNSMLSHGDTYAIHCFVGYPNYRLWR